MRSRGLRTVGGLIFSAAWAAGAGAAEGNRIAVKFVGGPSRLALGDVNAYLGGFGRFQRDDLGTAGYVAQTGLSNFHAGFDFEISITFPLTDRLSLFAGWGAISARKAANALILDSPFSQKSVTFEHEVSSTPIRLGFVYRLPLSSRAALAFSLGGALYLTTFREAGEEILRLASGAPGYEAKWDAETKASRPGFFAGLGFEVDLFPQVAAVAEIQGRCARLSGFHGSGSYRFGQTERLDDIDLYYYSFKGFSGAEPYPMLNLPNACRGAPLTELRDGAVDLSGWSIRAGLKFRF